jgi:Beta-lactamase
VSLDGVLDAIDADGPGAAIAVARDGEIVDFAAKGLANVEHRVPIGRETVQYLASTSKQFVACSIALLEQESDDFYLWTMSVLGDPDEIPIRMIRDDTGIDTALSVSMSRALDVRFRREGSRSD